MVTDPVAVDVVNACTVIPTPCEVAECVVVPADARTGAVGALSKARTSLTPPVEANVTAVPVSAVATSATASAESTLLSAGTFAVAGASVVVVLADPATVTAKGAAEAGAITSAVLVKAAAMTIAVFLNEFIFLLIIIDLIRQGNS